MPVQSKMASAELVGAGVRVDVVFLLSEISALLENGEENEMSLREELDWEKDPLSASSGLTVVKELAAEAHKNHL